MRFAAIPGAALVLLAAAPTANAHTWVEWIYKINSTGAFQGDPGYPIGYRARAQDVSDDQHQTKILDTSTNPAICKPLSSSDTTQYPYLKAGAGDYVALQYQENGHVSQPDLTPRPYRGGNVYVYGTMEHQDSDGINDVLNSWTVDGTGGNKKGKLIASHYFDDGQCFQDAPGNPIVDERSAKYGVSELYCQTDLQLPADLPSEGKYTLMWVWNWPRIIDDNTNVTEIYTSCAQIDLEASDGGESVKGLPSVKFNPGPVMSSAAIQSQLHKLIEATALGIGTNSPPAPTGVGSATTVPDSTPSSATASSTTHEGHNGHVKTVTVTAEPNTVTQFYTVTMGAGGGGNGDATSQSSTFETSVASPTTKTITSPLLPLPTSFPPVISVTGFLKARAARVTGQARRDAWSR